MDCPTIWPEGSRNAGSPMLKSEREAWLLGAIAAAKEAQAAVHRHVLGEPAPDYASHSDVDLSVGGER